MSKLRVNLVNMSDIEGGAARAAYRLHQALRRAGVDSIMQVNQAVAGDWSVQTPAGTSRKALARARPWIGQLLAKTLRTDNQVYHSPAMVPSKWTKRFNVANIDLVHLHWVNHEMMSISDIGRINKPVVWTLHDMWAFCGAEHYTEDFRWQEGYRKDNRPSYEAGFDLNKWVWNRKRKAWRRPMHIVTPSHWLAECARASALMRDWPVTTIHNGIDTDVWKPMDQGLARELLGLPSDVPLLLFGAMGGGKDPRKGFDLLRKAMSHLRGEVKDLRLIVFGQFPPKEPEDLGFPIHYTGHLHDDLSLRVLYNAADALVIPSKQDNLPNTGVEAMACGTPVIAFDTCGLPDIVYNQKTGYLAKAFDDVDLASGIKWTLQEKNRPPVAEYSCSGGEATVLTGRGRLSHNARQQALERFSYAVVARQYIKVYKKAVEDMR